MLDQPKPKFTKVKIKTSQAYTELEEEHKKNAPNPRISKLDQTEKEVIETSLQVEWECKIDNINNKHGVNYTYM